MMTYPVGHAVWDDRPDHHSSHLTTHDAKTQTRSIVHQLDLLHMAPLILQHDKDTKSSKNQLVLQVALVQQLLNLGFLKESLKEPEPVIYEKHRHITQKMNPRTLFFPFFFGIVF